jgi:two-component system chemotaxis response regulator CheY
MRALVIDDSPPARRHVGAMLAELGFEVYDAEEGGDGFQRLLALGMVELVILDWNMPGMDGLAFLKQLRGDKKYDEVLVIMATSNSDLASVRIALDAGASEYMMKPFATDDLRDKLQILGFDFGG